MKWGSSRLSFAVTYDSAAFSVLLGKVKHVIATASNEPDVN